MQAAEPTPDLAARPDGISIVLATYQGARFIRPQLESLLAQTMLPLEVIVSDDGSTDGTPEIVRETLRAAPFGKTLLSNPDKRGYSNNFFNAVAHAKGRYIAFCDQDDIWEPTKIATCLAALRRANALLCVHAATLIDEQDRPIGRFRQWPYRAAILPPLANPPWFSFYGFSIVFRADLLTAMPPAERGQDYWRYHESLAHDAWATMAASSLGTTVFLSEPLVRYRQHDNNVVGSRDRGVLRVAIGELGPAAFPLLNRSAFARRRAGKLAAGTSCDPAVTYWMRRSAIELSRLVLYRQGSMAARIGRFLRLLAGGGYRRRGGGLGWRWIPKDIAVGILRMRAPDAYVQEPFVLGVTNVRDKKKR